MNRSLYRYMIATNTRLDNMTVKVTRLQGRTRVQGTGEVSFDVVFPIKFLDVPHFTFGAELDKTSVATTGSFPSATACVIDWANEGTQPGYEGLYTGATLGVVVHGGTDQAIWVHWCFDGKALRNPVAEMEGVDDVL